METSRKRILYFIEKQGIKPKEFLEKTKLKKGFIDKSHENSGASDIYLAKILECYPNLSANWLLTGKGKMLTDDDSDDNLTNDFDYLKETVSTQKETIESQKQLIKSQILNIKLLTEKLNNSNK